MKSDTKQGALYLGLAIAILLVTFTGMSAIAGVTLLTQLLGMTSVALVVLWFAGVFLWLPGEDRRQLLGVLWRTEQTVLHTDTTFDRIHGERVVIQRTPVLLRAMGAKAEFPGDVIVTNKRILFGVVSDALMSQRFGSVNAWHPEVRDIPASAQTFLSRLFNDNARIRHVSPCETDRNAATCVRIDVDKSPWGQSFLLYHPQAKTIIETFSDAP